MIFKEIEKDLKELKLSFIINRWKPGAHYHPEDEFNEPLFTGTKTLRQTN